MEQLEYRRIYDVEIFVRDYHPKKVMPERVEYSGKGDGALFLVFFDNYELNSNNLKVREVPARTIYRLLSKELGYFLSGPIFKRILEAKLVEAA